VLSFIILNASAENGASSRGHRSSNLVADLADNRREIQRRRQVIDHRVEHRLHALVAERGADYHGRHRHLECGDANRSANRGGSGCLPLEVKLHDLLVVIGERLDHLVRD